MLVHRIALPFLTMIVPARKLVFQIMICMGFLCSEKLAPATIENKHERLMQVRRQCLYKTSL